MTDEKPKTETDKTYKDIAFDATMTRQLQQLTLDNAQLKERNLFLESQYKLAQKQFEVANDVIETDLKAGLILKLVATTDYKRDTLETLKVEKLQEIDKAISMTKGGSPALFKPIRAGNDSQEGKLTIGDLYGKSRKQILEMGGSF